MCRACNSGQRPTLSRRAFGQGVLAAAIPLACLSGSPSDVVDPRMRLVVPAGAPRTIALTLDACGGGADMRVVQTLLDLSVPATLFVTALWLHANPIVVALLRTRAGLFSLQNHGARHLPAVLGAHRVYGLPVAGTPEAVRHEVEAGADAVAATGAPRPTWYRGASALYSEAALAVIDALGVRIAAFSLQADEGASLPGPAVAARVAAAASGDVVIGHINQPHRSSGAGLADGIARLHEAGVSFVTLDALPVTPLSCHRSGHGEFLA